jgi:hypothetical protein
LFSFCSICFMYVEDPYRAKRFRLYGPYGTREGLSLIRGMKRSLTEEQQKYVAETIVHELETTNWKIEQGAPSRPPA